MRVRRVLQQLTRARVQIALGLALLATVVGLAIDMSGSAPRLAGDDHVFFPPFELADRVNGGSSVCVRGLVLPSDTARMVMTIAFVEPPQVPLALPRIVADFGDSAGKRVAHGVLTGAAPGEEVSIPLRYPHGPTTAGTLCLHVAGRRALYLGGTAMPAAESGTTIDGVAQTARPAILYYRPGSESWWQLLTTLDFRFGLGKSPIFGDWTLPVLVLVALALGIAVVRVLIRELR
jgi:hypothetical protein